jgi:ketosteroid isomerase-like protein
MLGEAEFRAMKPTAFYVCFSRGGVANDAALYRALTEGWIAGSGTPRTPSLRRTTALRGGRAADQRRQQAARVLRQVMDQSAETACQRLVIASYSLMDQGRYEETAALFTEDAVWVRGGKPVSGRAAILEALRQRPETDVSRHIGSNVLVEVTSDAEASATACFIPLRGARRDDGTVAIPPITNLGDLAYRFRREADGWRITHLRPTMVFKP